MPELKRLFDELAPERLADFERQNGVALPADYRRFLLAWNGGQPTPNQFKIPGADSESVVDLLYGIAPSPEAGDLRVEFDNLADQLPEGFIPIGHDPGGNLLLLATKGAEGGKVYYWDASRFFASSGDAGDTYVIARTIDEFLAGLHSGPR